MLFSPFTFRILGQPSDPETSPLVPARYAGDTTPRLVAQLQQPPATPHARPGRSPTPTPPAHDERHEHRPTARPARWTAPRVPPGRMTCAAFLHPHRFDSPRSTSSESQPATHIPCVLGLMGAAASTGQWRCLLVCEQNFGGRPPARPRCVRWRIWSAGYSAGWRGSPRTRSIRAADGRPPQVRPRQPVPPSRTGSAGSRGDQAAARQRRHGEAALVVGPFLFVDRFAVDRPADRLGQRRSGRGRRGCLRDPAADGGGGGGAPGHRRAARRAGPAAVVDGLADRALPQRVHRSTPLDLADQLAEQRAAAAGRRARRALGGPRRRRSAAPCRAARSRAAPTGPARGRRGRR